MSYIKTSLRLLVFIISAIFLASCSDDSENKQPTSSLFIQVTASILAQTTSTLRTWITIDNGTRTEMTISSDTATASISNLSQSTHTVLIEFDFTDSNGTVTLATASQTVDLSSGDSSISFIEADFDMASYDEDADGFSNAEEYIAGTNPWVIDKPPCLIGTSVIDNCAAG